MNAGARTSVKERACVCVCGNRERESAWNESKSLERTHAKWHARFSIWYGNGDVAPPIKAVCIHEIRDVSCLRFGWFFVHQNGIVSRWSITYKNRLSVLNPCLRCLLSKEFFLFGSYCVSIFLVTRQFCSGSESFIIHGYRIFLRPNKTSMSSHCIHVYLNVQRILSNKSKWYKEGVFS